MLKDKDSKQTIQVTIRVRPLSEKQKSEDPRICVFLDQQHSLQLMNGGQNRKFTFDSISYEQSQQQIFQRVGRRCTKDCLQGYNCTIFAYGQTGAGKTYTMMGVNTDHQQYEQHKGLIPRTMKFLFECIDQQRAEGVNFIIRCSFLEIYNEQIIDLLNKSNTNLQLREDTRKGVYVEGITEEIINRSEQIMTLLHKGSKSRHVGSTFYNETSSRSHSVFTMQIESKYTKNGVMNTKSRQFNFIDLAGSERTKLSTGQRLKEGCNINKSLMNLASVINALSEVSQGKNQHVNYRNSKLTFLLKDSLGGNSKTNLIANISPSSLFYQQTLSTLSFARRAKLIKRQKASINEDSSGNLDSMKNQIKRLKQEIIILMGRLQSGEGCLKNDSSQPPPQMTQIMHQYVAEEIDKQTRLQMQILRLNERISHLQTGIKHYSSNQTHLRMIISVLQDKITRLKSVQTRLSANLDQISSEEETKIVKQYFDGERTELLKQIESLKGQTDGARIIKELLKQAKIVKEEGEEQETLKELLAKNTNFLNMIHERLEEIAPEKQEVEFNAQFEKKVSIIEIEHHKKEEEFLERMEQASLQLTEARIRHEENEKLLEEAINGQIQIEQRYREAVSQQKEVASLLQIQQNKVKIMEEDIRAMFVKNEEVVSELKTELANKQMCEVLLLKQAEGMKVKIQKLLTNQKMLKQQFDSLQQQKYKLDKIVLQNIEQLKQQKNLMARVQSQMSSLQQSIKQLKEEREKLVQNNQYLTHEVSEQRKNSKLKIQQILKNHEVQINGLIFKEQMVLKEKNQLEQKLKDTEKKLSDETQELQILAKQYKDLDIELKKQISVKEIKIKELSALINQKEENGNQIEFTLNSLKAELINIKGEKEASQAKFKKIVDELKEKAAKDQHHFSLMEAQAVEKTKLYEELAKEQNQKRKEIHELNEKITKISSQNESQNKEVESLSKRLEDYQHESQLLKEKEKQQKVQWLQVKNELFISQKNSEIQLDAIRSQLSLKQQQLEMAEKEQNKNKSKYQKQLFDLQKQLQKNKEMFDEHEKSLKKSLQSQLSSKQKKLLQLRTQLSEKQSIIRQNQVFRSESSQKEKILQADKQNQQNVISELTSKVQILSTELEELKQEYDEVLVKHERQVEESEITHNEQLDQKTQQVEELSMKNNELLEQNRKLEKIVEEQSKQLLELKTSKAQIQVQLTSSYLKNKELFQQFKQFKDKIMAKDSESSVLFEKIEFLQEQKSNLTQKIAEMSEALEQNVKTSKIVSEQLIISKQSLSVKELRIEQLNKEIYQMLGKSEVTKSQLQSLSIENNQLCSKMSSMQEQFQSNLLAASKRIEDLQRQYKLSVEQKSQAISLLEFENQSLKEQLQLWQERETEKEESLNSLAQLIDNIKEKLQIEKTGARKLSEVNKELKKQLEFNNQQKIEMQNKLDCLNSSLQDKQESLKQVQQKNNFLKIQLNNLAQQKNTLQEQLAAVQVEKGQLQIIMDELKQKQGKQLEQSDLKLFDLREKNSLLEKDKHQLSKMVKDLNEVNSSIRQTLKQEEINNVELSRKYEQNIIFRQKWQAQVVEVESLKKTVDEDRQSKERLYAQVCKERETNGSYKMIIENSEAQIRQLEVQLEQKDAIYKKLLEKIAKNENENKKTTNSEHYLKTIELLEKSRSEQLDLRRQNDELKKIAGTLKQTLEQKQVYIKEVQKKSEGYCVSMHKRLQQIQKDYFQLQRNQQRLMKQKKALEKCSHQNDNLKEEIRNLKNNANKMIQRQEELQTRFKKCNVDYIELEKEFEELKKGQILITNHDDKTNYINRLKAEVAALKTEKVLLTDSLNREREEKTKLKAQMRFGKDGTGDIGAKAELQKKINQNKNLQELIFEVVSHLKICVNEPKTKLETIRSVILGTIKEKSNEVKNLKQRIKQLEEAQAPVKVGGREAALKEFRGLNSSYGRTLGISEEKVKFQKDKDPSILDNHSRQKMRQFQNYYARFKQGDQSGKFRNV